MKGFANECNSHEIMLAGESQGKIFLKITVLKKKRRASGGDRAGDFKKAYGEKKDISILKEIKKTL